MAFALEVLPEVASDEEGQGYYAQTYGASRLKRAYRITRDAAALLRPDEQGRPGVVNRLNDSVQVEGPGRWRVRSQRDRTVFYTVVRRSRRRYTCTCPDRDIQCKHKKAVLFRGLTGLAAENPAGTTPLSPLERWQRRYGQRRYTHAYYPAGSAVRVTGAFGSTLNPPTGYAAVSFDEENIPDRSIRLTQLLPSRNGQSVELTPCPEENWFAANC